MESRLFPEIPKRERTHDIPRCASVRTSLVQLLHTAPTRGRRDGEHARATVVDARGIHRPLLERTLSTAGLHHRQKKDSATLLSLPSRIQVHHSQMRRNMCRGLGRPVWWASGMSLVLCSLDASGSSAFFFFCSSHPDPPEWLLSGRD